MLAEPFGEHHAVDIVGLLQEECHLAVGSSVEELSDSFDGAVQSQFFHYLLGELLLVVFVEDSERLGITEPMNFLTQELDTKAVNSADEVVVVAAAHQLVDALTHLLCSFIGEGEAEDVGWIDTQHVDQIGIAAGERLGLARPRSGHHADSALGGLYCFALPAVEAADIVVHSVFVGGLRVLGVFGALRVLGLFRLGGLLLPGFLLDEPFLVGALPAVVGPQPVLRRFKDVLFE